MTLADIAWRCFFGTLIGLFLVFCMEFWRNFRKIRENRRQNNDMKWCYFDDFSVYDLPVPPQSLYGIMDVANTMLGNGCTFNGNFVTSFYHEQCVADGRLILK
jgi:hypothetical protein